MQLQFSITRCLFNLFSAYEFCRQNLLNNFDENQSGYETILKAFGSMMSVADQINEMKRAHERSVRIQEIQSLLYDWNRVDPITYGDLVLEVGVSSE